MRKLRHDVLVQRSRWSVHCCLHTGVVLCASVRKTKNTFIAHVHLISTFHDLALVSREGPIGKVAMALSAIMVLLN